MGLKKIYFAQPWGGLGDNLAYSNLPRLFNQKGIPFQVSVFNYSRNREIHELVWKQNKYVLNKVSIRSPNAGYVMFNRRHVNNQDYNIIQTINALHGFEPGNGYPEIDIINPNLNGNRIYALADLNAFSLFNTQGLIYDKKHLESLRLTLLKTGTKFLDFPNLYDEKEYLENLVIVTSLRDLISKLLLTDIFYCLNSGSHSLAATLKNSFGSPKKIVCFNPSSNIKNLKDWGYIFDNVEYQDVPSLKNSKPNLPIKIKIYKRILDNFS